MTLSALSNINSFLAEHNATLVAVSKTKTIEEIMTIYEQGQRIFGENRAKELKEKYDLLPKDIEWHMIGHLQKNKVKYIAPFVSLIHSVDSIKLLESINKSANNHTRTIDVLFQIKIAEEETKFGMHFHELSEWISSGNLDQQTNVCIRGLMGMATLTEDKQKVRKEFGQLKLYFNHLQSLKFRDAQFVDILSMGMSGDYKIALEEGANMVRIGSLIFGSRH